MAALREERAVHRDFQRGHTDVHWRGIGPNFLARSGLASSLNKANVDPMADCLRQTQAAALRSRS